MTMCEAMTDRMPDVSLGRGTWSREEHEHLASCAACRLEWEIVSGAGALGKGLTVDAARVTAGVLEQLRSEKAARRPVAWQSPAAQLVALAVAASILLAVVVRKQSPGSGATPVVATAAAGGPLQLAELESAAPDELQEVLAVFDVPVDPANSLNGADLEGLTDSQVENALRSWEESGG